MNDKLYEITAKKRFLWEPEKTNLKSFKFHNFTVFSQFLGNLKFVKFFLTSIRNCLWCYYRVFSIPGKFEIYEFFRTPIRNCL